MHNAVDKITATVDWQWLLDQLLKYFLIGAQQTGNYICNRKIHFKTDRYFLVGSTENYTFL